MDNLLDQIKTGQEAITLAGIQDDLAKILAEQTKLFGSMTTLRVGKPNNILPYDRPCAPKPITVHSKTSPLIGGFIPIDPLLNKLDESGTPIPHHHHDNLENQTKVQLTTTLYELLSRCTDSGNLEIIPINPESSSVIQFKIKQEYAPTNYDIIFNIDLNDQNDPTQKRVFTREPKYTLDQLKSMFQRYLGETQLEEDLLLHREFPIKYSIKPKQKSTDDLPQITITSDEKSSIVSAENPQKLMVFADTSGNPIAGDWDKDLESMALIPIVSQNSNYNQEFNTLKGVEEQKKLLNYSKELFNDLKTTFNQPKNLALNPPIENFFSVENFESLFNPQLLERAGAITPYEFLQNMLSNYCWNNIIQQLQYLPDPFQHGAENRSPFKGDPKIRPDPGGPRLHVYKGEFIYTHNEDQRVQLYSTPECLESNFIHIHPSANMKKWHTIIEKQVSLGQGDLISPPTINSYLLYKINQTPIIRWPEEDSKQWNNIVQKQIDFAQGPYILDPNPEDPNTYYIPDVIMTTFNPPQKTANNLKLADPSFAYNQWDPTKRTITRPQLPPIILPKQDFSEQLMRIEQISKTAHKQTKTSPNSPIVKTTKKPIIFSRSQTLPPISTKHKPPNLSK